MSAVGGGVITIPLLIMKRLSLLVILLCCTLSANAELTFQEIRTASNNVLVVYYKSDVLLANEVDINDLSDWKLNGQAVKAINKFVTEANACDQEPEARCERSRVCQNIQG